MSYLDDEFLKEYLVPQNLQFMREQFSFDQIEEGKFPFLAKLGTSFLVIRLRTLQKKIEKENKLERKIELLAKMTSITGYLSTIGIVIDTNDKSLASKIPKIR